MGAVRSSLILNDRMSSTLKHINKAMSLVLDSFEAVQRASGQTFNTANISAARQEFGRANAAIEEMEQNYRECNKQQNQLNNGIKTGTGAAGGLLGKVKAIAAAYLGMKGVGWVKESLALFDTQNNAEQQLKTVLKNMGAVGGAFDTLKEKAASLQKVTSFGDEALIGGAAEFATYMSDDKAIAVMMDTLANYAAGMSGGGEVGYKEMVDYATGLGKIVNGSYDAMTKKGFTFTEQQKKIIENGTDMEKALVISDVVNESWGKLAEQMANTPQGKIIQMKNAFGDMREELAARIYPAVMQLFDAINAKSGNIKGVITGLATPIKLILVLTEKLIGVLSAVYNFVADNWSLIAPILWGIAAAVIAFNVALFIHNALEAISIWLKQLAAIAAVAHGAAITEEMLATTGMTKAQLGFNAALFACPLTWILLIIIAVIAAIYAVVAAINKVTGSTISATGIIFGAICFLLAAIWNTVIGTINGIIQFLWTKFVEPWIGIVEWVLNVFNGGFNSFGDAVKNLLGNIISWFLSLGKVVTKIIDAIFGTNWTTGLTSLQDSVLSWGKNENAITLSREAPTIESLTGGKVGTWDYGNAWNTGYSAGESVDAAVSNFLDFSNLTGVSDPIGYGDTLDDIADATGDTANNTSKSSEELSYLRDIAEKEAINRFTTAEIKVDMTGMTNRIDSDMDLDGVISYLTNGIAEALATAGEGVY